MCLIVAVVNCRNECIITPAMEEGSIIFALCSLVGSLICLFVNKVTQEVVERFS